MRAPRIVGRETASQIASASANAAEEPQHLPAPQSLAQNRGTLGINAVNLKNMRRENPTGRIEAVFATAGDDVALVAKVATTMIALGPR
jgi:hypothetical protein